MMKNIYLLYKNFYWWITRWGKKGKVNNKAMERTLRNSKVQTNGQRETKVLKGF
jgi:hypothetical protein